MSGPPSSKYAGYIDPTFPNPGGPNDATVIIYGFVFLGAALWNSPLNEYVGTDIDHPSPSVFSEPFCSASPF
jgi:hypothetical protein